MPLLDVVAMQCRQPSLEGTGEIKLRRLVKEALRMRRSRIIVGEVRKEESLDQLKRSPDSAPLEGPRFSSFVPAPRDNRRSVIDVAGNKST